MELYQLLKIGKRPGREWALLLACGWMRRHKEQEVVRLAAYYKEEKDRDIRCQILRMLAYELLDEMQYDCNEEIRKYARRKLACMELD